MLTSTKIISPLAKTQSLFQAIALGFILAGIPSLPIDAQTITADAQKLEDIEAEEDVNWSFPSEEESISVKDEIEELGEYNLSESDSATDIESTEENREWGNRGDVENNSLEVEVYDY